MQRQILSGEVSQSVYLVFRDNTDGQRVSGIASGTTGLSVSYFRKDVGASAVSVVDLLTSTSEHQDGGFIEVLNGVYRLDMPDAAFTDGADCVLVSARTSEATADLVVLPLGRVGAEIEAIDEVSFVSAAEVMLAVLTGKTVSSGNTIEYKQRDGETTAMTIMYGNKDGERTGSVIA